MTPFEITDSTGSIVWSWANHESYGNSHPTEGIVGGQPFIFNLRFPGQWFDHETGLVQNGFRDYDPSLGRYVEVDPLGLAAGMNPYAYVGGNPLSGVDPSGLDIWIEGPNLALREPDGHQSINVGNPFGKYVSFSFGLENFEFTLAPLPAVIPAGSVYLDEKPGGEIERYKQTTHEQDLDFLNHLKNELGQMGIYGVTDIWGNRYLPKF